MNDEPPPQWGRPAVEPSAQHRVRLGRVFGAPVLLEKSWLLLGLLFVGYFLRPLSEAGPSPAAGLAAILCVLIIVFGAVFLHELAHVLAARAVGIRSVRIVMSAWGGHADLESHLRGHGERAVVAAAGPVVNLGLASAAYFLVPPAVSPVANALRDFLIQFNLLLGVFNALPALPLDGGHAIQGLATRLSGSPTWGMRLVGVTGCATAASLFVWKVVAPLVHGRGVDLSLAVIGGLALWLFWCAAMALLASFSQAASSQRALLLHAEDVMRPALALPVGTPLTQLPQGVPWVVVVSAHESEPDGSRPLGVVDRDLVARVGPEAHASTPIENVSKELPQGASLSASLMGADLEDRVTSPTGCEEFAVVGTNGNVVGLLFRRDYLDALTAPRDDETGMIKPPPWRRPPHLS